MKIRNLPFMLFLLIISSILISNSTAQTCPEGMISYWRLQESDGPVFADEKGSHNAIAVSSSPVRTQGISGSAQLFNGSSSTFLSVADHSAYDWAGTASFTVEFWVKFASSGTTQVFVGRDDPSTPLHWWIGATPTGRIEWYTRTSDGAEGDVTTTNAYNNGVWHHIVAVRDAAQGKNLLYVDGALAQSLNVTLTGNLASTAVITLGNMIFNLTPDYFYTGALDEVAIYNVALSAADVTEHYSDVKNYAIGYCDGDAPVILSTPAIHATVGQTYTYDVDASGNSLPTYSLIEKPGDMAINPTTGLISWTPASTNVNARVTVRATNDKDDAEQSYNIFLADAPDCRDNLIAYWDFDETTGAPYVDNISGYQLTGVGPVTTTGKVGKALYFDGANDSLNLADDVEPEKIFFDWDNVPSYSIEVWVKSDAEPSQTMVIVGREEDDNNSQFWLGINPDGTVGYFMRHWGSSFGEFELIGGDVLDNAWHHLVVTYNSTSNVANLYVDKILVATATQELSNTGGNDPMNVGCLNTNVDKFWFEGAMDELAFYNLALAQSTVEANYAQGVAGNGACVYNYAPAIVSQPDTVVNEDSQFSYKLLAWDLNPQDVITISAVSKPAWLTFTYFTNDTFAILSGTPDNALVGKYSVTLRVSDGSAQVDQTFPLRVANVNDAPEITSNPILTVRANEQYSYTITATDVDAGDGLTFTAETKPDWLTFTPGTTSATLIGTPAVSDMGNHAVILKVTDGDAEDTQSYTLAVSGPSAVNDIDNSLVEIVYPNPTSGSVYFRFANPGEVSIEIFDLAGNLQKLVTENGGNLVEINLSDLSSGVYVYKAYQNGKVCIGRIARN